jgi:23S rRNA pseudouridine1911/1915/1917 synthase
MSAGPDEDLVLRSLVPANAAGTPLLDYLAARFRYHDRAGWQRELDARRLTVDGRPASAALPLLARSEIVYRKAHREPWVDDRIAVLHEDRTLLVVDKPAHLPMHADGPFVGATLIARLRAQRCEPDLGLVHRLDRETSGVCVLARTPDARAALQRQFEAGAVAKAYHAVVRGQAPDRFVADGPIGRARDSAIALRRAVGEHAIDTRPARTEFTAIARGPAATLLRCVPHTGRTHQIRVHLEHAGFPILGDRLYGRADADYLAFVRAVKRAGDVRQVDADGPGRQLLHASALTFAHPDGGARVTFTAPDPPELASWLAAT